MSLADYTSLLTAVGTNWLHRSDLSTAQLGEFVQLFESDFNSTMRVRQMEQSTSQISTSGYLLHPTNWLGWKEIRGVSGGKEYHLQPVSDEVAVALTAGQGAPARYYKPTGSKTFLYPQASAVTFPSKYWEGVALTSGTNWLLTAYPGAYLYGSLLQATAFIGDDPRIGLWQAAYQGILDSIKSASRMSSWSGQALQIRPDSSVY